MAVYALDIDNRRIQAAMAILGIEESELLMRSIDDFAGPHVSPEIQGLRFDYYQKKLAETVKKIKFKIREDRLRFSTLVGMDMGRVQRREEERTEGKSTSLAGFLEYEQNKLNKVRERQRELLLKTYMSSQPASPKAQDGSLEAVEETETNLKGDLAKKKEAFEQKQQAHKARIAAIKLEKARFQRDLVRNMTQSMKEHAERGRRYEEQKKSQVLARAASYSQKKQEIGVKLKEKEREIDQLLDSKLVEIETKIARNRTLHSEELHKKASLASKLTERASTGTYSHRSAEEVERIKQYVAAQQQARARKQEIVSKQSVEFEGRRQKVEEKMEKIKKIQKIESEGQLLKIKQLERRMKTASLVLEKKEKDWGKEMELRLEQQRLMDEDKRNKVERTQRIYNLRREKLLEKLLRHQEKVENLRKEQALKQAKHQETAIQIMIEKERTRELQGILTRSPQSKAAQEKLKLLEIRVRQDSVDGKEEDRVVTSGN